MTLEETVLQKLAEAHAPREGRHTVSVPDAGSGWLVQLEADRQEELSCALWEMVLQRTGQAPAGLTLQSWATAAVARVTSLLEALRIVEIDIRRNEALLRSEDPTKRRENVYYYEIRLKGTEQASVQRFRATHDGGRREQIPFTLTHEALAKLASDLAG